jgi:2OG-Fe(II) oxygenase superfamily
MLRALSLWRKRQPQGASLPQRPLYSIRECGAPSWTTVPIATDQRKVVNLVDRDGMSLIVETMVADLKTCVKVGQEVTLPVNHQFWRRFPMQGIHESRIHLYLHAAGLTPMSDKLDFTKLKCKVLGYWHGRITMIPVSMNMFEEASDLIDVISSRLGLDRYYWNCGIDIVMFRSGKDKIGAHADDTQSETDIVTFILECDHDRVIKFEPKNASDGLPSFELYLRTGDMYRMNGKLQEKYVHSVDDATGVTQPRLAMVFRRGSPHYVTTDSGSPAQDLDFPRSWMYTLDNHPRLVEGGEYRFNQLLDLKCLK